jgi:carboxymethylenebutenolidase
MRRFGFAAIALLLGLGPFAAFASEPAPLVSAVVHFPETGSPASGYLALPPGKGPHPAIIVIQEWWGLTPWVRQQADRFAAQGYVALAVDLYRGRVAQDAGAAHELMRGMPEDRAVADLRAGFAYLAKRKDVDAKRIGAIGWCMGGGYSLALATVEPQLAAAVINYGRLVTEPATIQKIHAPILGNFGGADRGITPEDIQAFVAAMKKAKKQIDVKIYDGAAHAFMNPGNDQGFDEAATADAWKRIDAFFAVKLRAKIPNS